MPAGTILKLYSNFVDLALDHAEGEATEVLTAKLRGRLTKGPKRGKTQKSLFAVGDRVQVAEVDGEVVVESREERRSKLSRQNPRLEHQEQVIAANVDQVLIVASAELPLFLPRLVDRYLVAASVEGLGAALCLTKCDLTSREEALGLCAPYTALGFPCHLLALGDGASLQKLTRELLDGKVTVLVGQSGVGKSTLRNALLPAKEEAKTGKVSERWGKGRHVTSAATLEPLPGQGFLVDTPGIREFGLFRLSARDLPEHFVEFAGATCKFNDCSHRQEPGCALIARVEAGDATAERLDSLRAIAESLNN